MKYFLSPELHRNLWLRFSPFKFVAAPFFFFLLVAIITNSRAGETNKAFSDISDACLAIYCVIAYIWGCYEAGTAMQEEIRGKTWDLQRLSAITPAKLAFGKLFGATSYTWYAGLWPLLIIAYTFSMTKFGVYGAADLFPVPGGFGSAPALPPAAPAPETVVFVLFYLVLAALFGQGVAFLAGFADADRKEEKPRYSQGIMPFIVGMAAAFMIYGFSVKPAVKSPNSFFGNFSDVTWYYMEIGGIAFITASLLFFLAWIYIGIYRVARAELMFPAPPSAWILFVISVSVYAAGLTAVNHAQYYAVTVYVISGWSLFLTYASLLNEAADIQKLKRMASYFRQRNISRMWENLPRWISSAPLVLVFFAVAVAMQYMATGVTVRMEKNIAILSSLILFAARDGIVLHALALTGQRKHYKFKQVFYFIMAYILLPALHLTATKSGGAPDPVQNFTTMYSRDGGAETAAERLISWYYPSTSTEISQAVVPVLLQVCVAAGMLYWLSRRRS